MYISDEKKGTVPVAPQSSSRKPQCQSYVGYESPLVILLGGRCLRENSAINC